MIVFFKEETNNIIAVKSSLILDNETLKKLTWLFSNAVYFEEKEILGIYVGPRKEMITPWSTNAVEITQNMGIKGIERIEKYAYSKSEIPDYDPMLERIYKELNQQVFTIDIQPEPIQYIQNIGEYNLKEGLALNKDEIIYLENLSNKLKRKLTDSEIFGFSQVNSEHCRHKIFNGIFIIDGKEKQSTLFQLIKETTKIHPNKVVSAYKDNCAFIQGPVIEQFAPKTQDKPDYFEIKDIESVISIKAETHNFPTTVEPFNGAATGSGGEIRDRIAGGKAAIPLAGTAISYTFSNIDKSIKRSKRFWKQIWTTPYLWKCINL
jgi:phosphoribosylformylglycinamidine synthase